MVNNIRLITLATLLATSISIGFTDVKSGDQDSKVAEKTQETVVKTKHGSDVATVADVEEVLQAEGFFEPGKNKLVLFDFDGVIFVLGGSELKHIDMKMAELVKKLKKAKVTVGGLTNRTNRSAYKSIFACKQAFGGFNMLQGVNHWFTPKYSSIQKGIMYNGRRVDKGLALEEIFKRINADSDTEVAFLDDSPQNLKDVERACRARGIKKLVNIHYVASWRAAKRVQVGGFFVGPVQLTYRKLVGLLPHKWIPNF